MGQGGAAAIGGTACRQTELMRRFTTENPARDNRNPREEVEPRKARKNTEMKSRQADALLGPSPSVFGGEG